ncbi:MAG: GH116 family glycosyl hydrolase [Bacteroidales bacterium]
MKKLIPNLLTEGFILMILLVSCSGKINPTLAEEHQFNGSYTGKFLDRVSFPIGGIGAGMFCMDGTGSISHLSIKNKPEMFNEPIAFAAISVKGIENGAKLLEAQVPEWKLFGPEQSANGAPGKSYGLPRFEKGTFLPRFPFATLKLDDKDIPLDVEVLGWSPFVPTEEDQSSLPVGAMEYTFKNNSSGELDAVFSWNSRNFVLEWSGRILKADRGFILTSNSQEGPPSGNTGFAAFIDDPAAIVDYCWFRGEWFDPHMILWKNIENGTIPDNAPVESPAPGASIFVPFKLKPGEEKTIVVQFCWYSPESNLIIGHSAEDKDKLPFYQPWYVSKFKNLGEVIDFWTLNHADLKRKSELFRDAFFSSTLPPEVIEAVSANLTILKSPTVLRQLDGRLWGWEGCSDNEGCCPGSCTHVWNYAQAVPHLFPALERTLRETEFQVNQNEEGHQTFRSNLPISPLVHNFHAAADGQLGGIMKVYRDWRISGDTQWMLTLLPLVKNSMDYCIETWDPGHKGYLEEPHHNTYDIEFWGPDGMCTSFYLGALSAIMEMNKAAGIPYDDYESLLQKGKLYTESELFDGEYFIQNVKWEGLKSPNPVETAKASYRTTYTDEALELLKSEGPKYQYGKGCLSDGILGMWMATVCGLDEVIETEKVKSHLKAVHQYNLRKELVDHANPQRPTFAAGKDGGLLLCTWPKGGKLSLPFIYSNEVWTGIEYQVASHLMFKGEVEKGLEIVRQCRERYDGRVRNPFNEYECGAWYARAMSSYALLEGLTGVRYDAVDRVLYIDSKVGDFNSFISTETGFGNVGLKNGEPYIHVVYGEIEGDKIVVSGREKEWK